MEESEKADSEPIPTNDDASPSQGKSCALCGCATPAVRCDRCNSQIFCLSCDDMYHRHPKRKLHLRKAVDSIWTTARSPRLRRRTELPGDPCKIPIPPPRSKKREHRTIGGRTFLKSGLELGSFGHSKVFSPASKDFFAGQKSPASMVESNCDDGTPSPNIRSESGQIYENDNITNATGNLDDRSPWNPRPNISSPIQVSIPSSSPDIVANGQPFGYPAKPHSQSAADLTAHTGHPVGQHPYHFHPPYHPYMHPPMHPYSHSMAHLNCAQCISNSWSNLISPHPSPYFHPMPWGSAQNTLARPPVPGQPGPMKHSHGDLSTYPDSGFHYPYPGAPYYHNGPPVVDPNFIKDLHEQAEMQKQRKEAKSSPRNEEMDIATNPSPMPDESSSAPTADAPSTEPPASTVQDAPVIDEAPPAPVKPTEPWSCVHCTFINPPGIHICQVCCKTSYGNKPSDAMEEQNEDRPDSRDTDSPLINRDALINSPGVSEIRDAQKDIDEPVGTQASDFEYREQKTPSDISTSPAPIKFTTETQTFTTTKTTDVQTQNITRKSIASSTDSIFPKQEMSVQTEIETLTKHCSVATDPMISSQSLESLLSGVSAPPYHNRRAGWGRGATSFSTQSLYERGRSRSPMPRSHSFHTEAPAVFGRDSSFASEEAMHSASQAWLYSDPMYYKPHNRVLGQSLAKEDYFDGTWGSMDRLNHRVKHKKDKEKLDVRPKFHRSLDDLKPDEKKPEFIRTHELMMLQTVKEAERCGFTLDDLHVAYLHCGKENPVFWLEDNWPQMIKNVIGLAAKYGEENEENDVGAITTTEAKEALRIHRGDIWDAVAECIETRQRKILELTVRGNFTQKQIAETLKNNEGNVELAYADLLRASTRRHKFILSPGLSTDSEDLNVYNPTEDSTTEHNLSVSPMKAAKHDAAAESKSEKKKSDFLTKLTAIREAQSERRKAREEKELIRETITQDLPISAESEAVLKKDISIELTPSISREDSKEVEEILQGGIPESEEVLPENKLETEVSEAKDVPQAKETVEDSIPVDFDTNWSESQGEWIEEYSDEHWEEGDEHWDGLGKKFQKMQKEFEEEAMQMAALWEKEELEDDVFEEETKVQQENEPTADSDKKFDDWVKANLKGDSLEYEEDIEMKEQPQDENIAAMSLRERLDLEGSRPSPLQHYATALDLSLKSQFESDWVDLPADAEIEKLAHDIVCEGSDIENKFDEPEMVMYEEEKPVRKVSDQGSDEDWEKIEMDEQLQEVNELDRFAFPEKEGEMEREAEEEILDASDKNTELPSEIASEITIEKDTTVLYKNLESVRAADASDVGIIANESSEATDVVSVQPKAPVRRKSKLSSTDLDDALKYQPTAEISSDIPPPLPEKSRYKGDQQKMLDIYAVPDKTAKIEDHISTEFDKDLPSVPQKPPRLNLSPTVPEEKAKISQILTKEGSPITSLSYESDSNFFADSESETEMKSHRPKNIHKKLAKYENEFEESEIKDISIEKLPKRTIKEKKETLESPFDLEISQATLEKNIAMEKDDILESNFDLELDEDIDPSLIEPLPRMKDIDYDPELPILLGGRGRQISDIDDVNAPKAFREDTTRPLQLFKVIKKETSVDSVDMPAPTAVESQTSETSFIQRISNELPMPTSTSNISYQPPMKLSEPVVGENEAKERLYYNDSLLPQQGVTDSKVPQFQPQEEPLRKEAVVKETEPVIQAIPATQEEEIPSPEMEALSAAADYFFGRYNEITVTPTKKKTSTRARPLTASAAKSPSKVMSSSEISSPPQPETTPQMDQSAAAVLQEKPLLEDEQDSSLTKISRQQKNITESAVIKEAIPPPEKPKPPAPTECLSFAEDYLFGCYNQVVPTRKTKNVPVISAKIPKLGEIQSLSRPQSPLKEQKLSSPISTPEPPELPIDKQEQEVLEEDVPEEDENDISIRTDTSATYDDVFHDFPPEMLSNQSFDESSIYYESFQDAVEDAQGNSMVDGSVVNVRPKSVHFEEAPAPLVPPRRKTRGPQKGKAPPSSDANESYANEYLFRHYEIQPQSKKKLPLCSKDFRMNQGFEPTEIPSDTSLTPEEDEEEEICSETSVKIPLKSNELLKSSLECDFGDSEQPLELIEHDIKKTELKDSEIFVKSDDSIPHLEDTSLLVERKIEIASNLRQDDVSTDNQSEKSESFEELSIPDNLEEIIESSNVSEQLYTAGKEASAITESEVVSIQQVQSYDTNETSNRLEMDQFVFIEQAQDIIDDSYNLYDIQGALVCDLNYVDVKGNIEDECTDDSEQEWKRNEDRKNTLNASFLANAPIKMLADNEEESVLDKSQHYDQKEPVLDESQNELETVLDGTQKSDIEIEQKIDESKSTQSQDERKSGENQNLEEDFELTECIKEDLKFPEHSEDICIENQFITTEVHDAELDIAAGTIEPKVSTTTDEFPSISESVSYDDEEIKVGPLETSQDIKEDISSIDEEFQIMSENITTESFEKLTEKIDENLLEIEKELYESVPYEYDDVISEELNVSNSVLELDDATIESFVEETEISETHDTTMIEETKLEISKEETEISEIADALTKEKTKLESSELEFEVSEITDTVMEEESAKRNIDETCLMDEDEFLYDDQQIYGLEAFEASGDLSDDNVSSHSSVSTEIAVSMKVALKESEGDECSLNLEQIDNFEDDSEISLIGPSQKTEDNEQNISETDLEQLKKSEEVSDIAFSKEEKHEYEAENFESEDHKIESEECRNELTPIPFMYDPFTDIYTPKILLKESVSDENLKCEEEISDGIENIIEDIADEDKSTGIIECDKIKDHVLSPENSLYTESIVPETIETTDSESKSNELEKGEIGVLMAEESIMSRFYDEWYQNESSTKFSFLSTESIYAKFGKSESSESGNESDSALSTVDFKGDTNEAIALKSESSLETQILKNDIKVYDSEEKLQEKEIMYEEIKYDAIDISQESTELGVSEIKNEVDTSSDLSVELKLKSIKDDQQMVEKEAQESVVSKDTDISSFIQEKTELDVNEVKNEVDISSDLSVELKLKSIKDDQQMVEKEAQESVVSKDTDISSFIQEKTELDVNEAKNEVDISSDLSVEFELKSIKDHQKVVEKEAEESVVSKDTEISSFIQEKTESVVLQVDEGVSIQSIKDQEISDSEKVRVNNKFSTSKSCQTEDSFEEDVFFDSFDDTFTIPSYIHLPIENQTKPPSTDISIQCELISIDDILSSKKILSISQTEVITAETQMIMPEQSCTEGHKLREQQPKVSELASEEKEESSCESFEDSDSDIFIESPSSQDELDVGSKRGLLYAEVDSDTGFSSGSECGWTKKSDYKQKELKKVSQTSSASKISSLQASVSSSEKQEIAVSVDSSVGEKAVEISSISEKKMAADIIESNVDILSDNARSSPLPPEIIERAITPVAIPQFPSFEDDLVFVEVKEDVEEITGIIEEEIISTTSTTPTVEYFYGPLPGTIKIDSPPESNENFFETASELSESASFSADKTESFSDSTSSLLLAEKMSHELNVESNISSVTKGSEDESFGETISSLKGETEDSISEYYSFPESVSLLSRASLAESDIFDIAQSEIFTDDFLVDSHYEEKKVKSEVERFDLSVSESNKISGLITDKPDDKQPQEISSIVSVIDAKETHVSSDVLQVAECKKSLDDQALPEKANEILSIHETDPSVEIEKTVPAGELIDSKTVLSAEEAQIFETAECESVTENVIKPSSDVPPVPSDIVRYLYYDDSITFDDESYHTQSGSIEAPSLTSQEAKLIDSTDKETIDEAKEKISIKEICTISSFQATGISEEKITVSTVQSETESIPSDKLSEKRSEMLIQDFAETPIVLEKLPDKTDLATDSATKTSENITDLAEKTPASKECLLESVPSLSETELKFPSIEVLPLESAAVLPAVAEQTFESVVCKEESVIVSDTSFEEALALSRDQDVEPVGFKQTSEIPPVPSDIVRYLYYDDDISFDEMTQSSFYSQHDNEVTGSEGAQLPLEAAECSNVKPIASAKPELLQDVTDISPKLSSELNHQKPNLIDEFDMQLKLSDEESSYKPDSGSAKDESHVPFDSSECYEDWFDLKETTDILKHDSEQYSSTRSSALKEDSEPPCIPEYILSPKLSDNIPIGKNDVDEVTDISTHFTMTDDSDRFSDIENDISLNFEEEYILPMEASDQIQFNQLKDEELFESCMKREDDEIYINTSEIEDAENEFQFFTPEQIKELPELEKITESISPKEIAAELPKELLKESVTSTELNVQQIHEETKLELSELKEKSDMRITSTDSSELVKEQTTESLPVDQLPEQLDDKEIIQQHISQEFEEKSGDMTENFDECITSTSEVSKDEFAECLTSSELVEQSSDKDIQKKIEEIFDECITITEVSDTSKEQFVECLTSNKLSEEKVKDVDKVMPESSLKELPQQLNEYTESDENGNFPEPIIKEVTVSDSTEVKDNVSSEILETSPATKKLESSLAEKDGEIEIVDFSVEHSVYSEPSHDIPDKEVLSHEKPEVNLQPTEIVEDISADKDDLETSCYATPVEESHSISTEVSDNWSDADGIYIEEDESVYDIPLEDINIIHSDICTPSEESKEKLTALGIDFVKSESFSSETKVTDSEKIDISALEFSEKKVIETDLKITETASLSSFKLDMNETTEDINTKFIESAEKKQSEISQGYSYEPDKISEIDKILVSDDITKSLDSEKSDSCIPDSLSGEKSEQSQILYDSLLPSDMKLIQEVKLETQSEISSTLKEKVHFECMSTTSGAEPTFSQAEMIHESQNIQSEQISSKDVCFGEEIITSTLTQAYVKESSSGDQITPGTAVQEAQVSDVDVLETSDFKTMETKSLEILDSELSEYISISDSSKSNELNLNNIPLEVKDKELILNLSPEDKITEEFGQSLVTSSPQIETTDYVSTKSCDIKEDFSFISTDITQESTLYSISENVKLKTEDSAKSMEIVDFKGDLSKIDLESIPKTTPVETIPVFPDEDSNKKVHLIRTQEDVDFSGCKIEQNIIETEEKKVISAGQLGIEDEKSKSETVDFRGTVAIDEDHISFKMKETTAVISEKSDLKFIQGDKFAFGSDVPFSETVDFKGGIAIGDFYNKSEAADKSCDEVPVAIDKKESKTRISSESLEVVDFKMITGQDMTELKTEKETIDFKSGGLVDEKISVSKEINLSVQEKEGPFETVDFKGQLINLPESEKINITSVPESESTFIEIMEISKKEEVLKPVELVKTSVIEESLPIKKEIAFHKAESSETHEVVDFKGQLTARHDILESMVEDVTTSVSDVIFYKDETGELEKVTKPVMIKDSKQTDTFEVVDFKGSLSVDELKIQSDDKIMKDVPTIKEAVSKKLESDTVKVEPLKEVVDFKGTIDSSCPEIGTLDKKSDAISYDSQETSYSFPHEQDIVTYDQPEIYSYSIDEQAVIFDPRETYGYSYGFDEQVCESQQGFEYGVVEENEVLEPYDPRETYGYSYGFDEHEVICESQTGFQYGVVEESESEQKHYEEVKASEVVSYITSTEESAELYSCAETLSAASDTSLQFHSLSHDLEDTLNLSTSEDFTDVPSHLTSTEDSDKWSDVEGDFSLEDVEYDRDKTPTRTPHEITTTLKEEFKSNIDGTQLNENLTESVGVKVESMITSDSEKLITSASELVATDLSAKVEKEDSVSVEIAPDSQKIKETKESEICAADAIINSGKSIPEAEITDQIIIDKSIKTTGDIKTSEDNTSTPLMEHFADIQSIKDYPSTTVVPFSSIDIEKAVPKMHEDISCDVSSETEKTESEFWLEAETEHSISELSEDIAVCIEEDGETKFIFVDYEKPAECFAKISEPSGTPHTSTTSTSSSSSYSDFENSDHTSDTYADISLQGATTESSDKWSDFEMEGLVDDVLYDNIEIPETVEITDFSQLIKKPNESKLSAETPSPEDNLKDIQGFETAADISSVEAKIEIKEVKIIKEETSDLLKESESTASVESTEFSSANVTDFEQTFSTETSTLPSSAIAKVIVGLSDEEFTDVTPLEITAESDKLSDISDDTSFGEIEDEGSISLKANLKRQDQELDTVSCECKTDSTSKFEETESVDLQLKVSEKEEFIEKSGEEISIQSNIQLQSSSNVLSYEMSTQISGKEQDIPVVEVSEKLDEKLTSSVEESEINKQEEPSSLSYTDTTKIEDIEASLQLTDSFNIKSSETCAEQLETAVSQTVKEISSKKDIQTLKTDAKLEVLRLDSITTDLKDKIDVEDSSSSKITDDSETLDNFTDVPTHTVTSETSDAYLDLESDHSFEEIENFQAEAESTGLQEAQTADITSLDAEVPQDTVVAEHYENSLPYKDFLEDADDFALDAIPENELENYEDEEYSLSEHFEINEDELIYPLPYNDDWIEQSFELKEYGVEAEFYESESDIHGLGIAHEDYDDEDIQRAIDYNLSTFEEDEGHVENVITTESFKTLSHDSSAHLKPDEYETWSTADAPSIEEELGEQDNVLSKIDEILAEDFGDIYQADSYLKHDEDIDDYLSKDISASGNKCDDFIQSDKISLTKFDSEATHEITKIDTVHGEVTQKQIFEEIMKTELDSEAEISQMKVLSEAFETEIVSSKIKTDEKLSLKTESETTTAAITVQEDTSRIHKTISDSVKKDDKTTAIVEDSSTKIDSELVQEIDSKPTFDKTIQKDFSEMPKTGSDIVLSDISVDKNAVQTFKAESTYLSSEITVNKDFAKASQAESEELSSKLTIKKDSKLELKSDSEIESDELALKKSFEKVSEVESDFSSSEMTLEKDSVKKSAAEFDSVSSKIAVEKDYTEVFKTKSEEVPSEINFKRGGSKPESKPDTEIISDEVSLKRTPERGSKVESDITSYEATLDRDSVCESKIKAESITSEITVDKDKSEIFKTESESVSSVISLKRGSKSEVKPGSETISDQLTIKKVSQKDSESEFDVVSDEVTLKKDSIKETKFKSDSLSTEIAMKKDYEATLKSESEVMSDKINVQRDLKADLKTDSDIMSSETLKKDYEKGSKIKSESITSEITIEKDKSEIFKTESESVSSVISLKRESKSEVKPVSETITDELTIKKLSKKDSKSEFDVASDEVTLKKDSIKETKIKSDSLSTEIAMKKDYEATLKTESEVISDKISIQRDFKVDLKTDSDIVSSETLKKDYEKDSRTDSDVVSSEITLKKESVRETKFVSDAVSGETIIKKDSDQIIKLKQDFDKEDRTLLKSTDKIPEQQISSVKETSGETKITKSSEISLESKDISSSADVSTAVISSLVDTHKDKTTKDQFSDVATLSVSKTDSSADIPLTKSQEIQKELTTSCKISKESEVTEPPPSSLLSESVKHSMKSVSESKEVQLNIPEQKVHKDETSSVTDTISKEQTSDSLVVEVKPDIPKKTKQKSLDLTETIPLKEEPDKKPSLPPKKSKRHSLTDSASSSLGESLSSSSSAESLASFESAIVDKSKKSSDEASMHSLSPDVPTRRSRSSKASSSRSTSRDSDDSSSCSRSSSLKIRRRSSNFAEPEPFDLSKKRASIDERMKKLQIEGKCTTKEKAFIAAKLIEMQFEEEDALLASRQCNTVYHAVKFLTQLCDMCNCRFPINLMSSLVNCTHRACKECLKAHFTSLLYDRSVFTLLCPICHKPDITDQNIQEYFTHLDMTLRNILEDKVYDLFQRKLRDEVLTKDPNFHWCSQCSSGFIASPRLKKLYCPDCSAITCAMCHQTWELEHEGVHCERFQQWKDMHTPEPPPAGLVKFLIDRGISCPSCGLVYAQACGGCMMYKCSHCSFEFCGFCIRPLKKGRECSNEICDSRGHHIHHLHNCLFFLRDKDITEIQMLLEEESVTYFTIPPKNQIVKTRCQVREQKINHGVLTEDRCGRSIEPYCGGLCRTHYYEYLAELLRKNKISPLSIMTIQDLQFMLRKSRIFVPEKVKGETSEDYYERLLEFVTKSIT